MPMLTRFVAVLSVLLFVVAPMPVSGFECDADCEPVVMAPDGAEAEAEAEAEMQAEATEVEAEKAEKRTDRRTVAIVAVVVVLLIALLAGGGGGGY